MLSYQRKKKTTKNNFVLDEQSDLLWFLTNDMIKIISRNYLFLIKFGHFMKVFNVKVIQTWLIMKQLFGPFNDPD